MTYEEIFTKAEKVFKSGDLTGFDGDFAVQVDIQGEGEGAFYIAYKNGALDVAPYEYYDRDAILMATAEDFVKIAEGSLDAVAAFTVGKLKVDGSIDKALELQKMINVMEKNAKSAAKSAPKAAAPKAPAKNNGKNRKKK